MEPPITTSKDRLTEYIPLSDARITELAQKAEIVGARIHVLRGVSVQQGRKWQEAVKLAGPNTPTGYDVFKEGIGICYYPPVSHFTVVKDMIILNYLKEGGGDWYKARAWGKDSMLKNTNPRELFAIGEQYPDLHITLQQDLVYVVETTGCRRQDGNDMCAVRYTAIERVAVLFWDILWRRSFSWFAFCEQ
jgi:hypothetical protein